MTQVSLHQSVIPIYLLRRIDNSCTLVIQISDKNIATKFISPRIRKFCYETPTSSPRSNVQRWQATGMRVALILRQTW